MAVLVGRASNKGGRWKRNREEIGAGAMKNRLHGRGAFFEPKQEMAIYSLLHGRDAMAIFSTGFGNSMIFTVFFYSQRRNVLIENLYDRHFASKSILDDQISDDQVSTKTVNLL